MNDFKSRSAPGRVRDAILQTLSASGTPLTVATIEKRVAELLGPVPNSSIRSYLRLNTPSTFVRESRGVYRLPNTSSLQRDLYDNNRAEVDSYDFGSARLVHADCMDWLTNCADSSIHAVVTDPPYGLHEYSDDQQCKLRGGRGGVWRIPPAFDGHARAPLPRFTTLTASQLDDLARFFYVWATRLKPKLVPGAHVLLASNPLVSYLVSGALADAGLERRGELIRLTMTMRGGDRPKAAHDEFRDVTVMPRSMWEPWLIFRKPLEGRVQDNLRKWGTGGFRRPSDEKPFGDVISSAPTRKGERNLAPHPSLKPQKFMRQIVRAVLPLGSGTILDPFAGAGSTLAAAEAIGYSSIGIEKDPTYFEMARESIPLLAAYEPRC